ncbi:nitroreductase family protein [soil metagenome]
MNTDLPDVVTLRTALALAVRAPSVHNLQPWQWRVGASSLHLYADAARRLMDTDPDGRDVMVSCGAALNHCVVALAALGWRSKIHRFPNSAEPLHLAAIETYAHAADEVDIALAAAIPRRRTDRRIFSSWPVAHGDISIMGVRAARMGIAMRHVEPSVELRAALAPAVWQHVEDRRYLDELARWTGRSASAAGVGEHTALAQQVDPSPADDHSVLLALGSAQDDDLARLRVGEAASLVLLTATGLGLASCPVTEPLGIPEARTVIRADAFADKEFPQMLLRVGWAPINAEPLPSTPRLPFDESVVGLNGSRFG